MLVLAPRIDGTGLKIEQNSGTSYATPLAANIAAKIVSKYPNINMQSVKALMINSAEPIKKYYLEEIIDELKFWIIIHIPMLIVKKTLLSKSIVQNDYPSIFLVMVCLTFLSV